MRNFWLILSVLWLWTCSGGGDKATGPEEPPIVINLTSLGGQAQKGPFNNGTTINIAELTNALSPTGRNFSSAITDNTGRFAVANVQLESPYVELRANGYYFNEVANEISSGQLTLFALSNLTGKTSLNVNIITHLEKNRMVTLMSGDNPKTFAQAKLQAQEEVLAIFDYSRANVPESELLDISQGGAANAKLLAISAIIQGNLNTGQMSELLANISTDIASDGTLDDTNLRNTLIENSKNLDMAEVRSNLEARYVSLGITATIPDFETEINQFLKPPVAQDMSASTGEDTPINITLAGSDPEDESLTYTILEVNNATVTLNGNVANYTPDANFNGTDTFTYYANDGTSDSNIATVTMTVSGEDDDPNTQNAAATTDEDVAVVLQLSAEEYDGDSYSFGIISNPSNGSVSLDGANATYTPNQDYNGTDSFTFEATDDTGRMINVGTATITINPVNDAPVLTTTSVSVSVDEEQSVSFTIDATDVDGDQLQFGYSNDDPSGNQIVIDGTVDINSNTYTYTPYSNGSYELSEGATRGDTFYYYAMDNSGLRSQYLLTSITVVGVDDLPHADNLNVTTNEDSSLLITLTASDPDGGDNSSITYEIPQNGNPSNGTVSISNASATYVPNVGYVGSDSFQYNVVGDSSNPATVSIEVRDVIGKLFYINIPGLEDYTQEAEDIYYDDSLQEYHLVGKATHKYNQGINPLFFIARYNGDLELIDSATNISGFSDYDGPDYYSNWDETKNLSIVKSNIDANPQMVIYDTRNIFAIDFNYNLLWTKHIESFINNGMKITNIFRDSNANLIISGMTTDSPSTKPFISKSDAFGNIYYSYLLDPSLDNLGTDRSFNSSEAFPVIEIPGNSNKYLMGLRSSKINFASFDKIKYFEFYDNGTDFELSNQHTLDMPYDAAKTLNVYDIELTAAPSSGEFEFHTLYSQGNDYVVQRINSTNNNLSVLHAYENIYNESFRYGAELVKNTNSLQAVLAVGGITVGDVRIVHIGSGSQVEWKYERFDFSNPDYDGYDGHFSGADYVENGKYAQSFVIVGDINFYINGGGGDTKGYILLLDQNGG